MWLFPVTSAIFGGSLRKPGKLKFSFYTLHFVTSCLFEMKVLNNSIYRHLLFFNMSSGTVGPRALLHCHCWKKFGHSCHRRYKTGRQLLWEVRPMWKYQKTCIKILSPTDGALLGHHTSLLSSWSEFVSGHFVLNIKPMLYILVFLSVRKLDGWMLIGCWLLKFLINEHAVFIVGFIPRHILFQDCTSENAHLEASQTNA